MTLYRRIERGSLRGGGQYLMDYFAAVNVPVLQRVTPEAMAELEQRGAVGVLVASEYGAGVLNYSQQYGHWWRDEWGASIRVDRPWRGWFIELATLKEVQQ